MPTPDQQRELDLHHDVVDLIPMRDPKDGATTVHLWCRCGWTCTAKTEVSAGKWHELHQLDVFADKDEEEPFFDRWAAAR